MRLNNENKEAIVKALALQVVEKKFNVFIKRYYGIVNEVAVAALGDHQAELRKKIPKKLLDKCFEKSLHIIVITKASYGTASISPPQLKFNSTKGSSRNLIGTCNPRHHIPEYYSDFYSKTQSAISLDNFPALYQKYNEYSADLKKFMEEVTEVISDIESVVYACTTMKKLIEVLPAAEQYIPIAKKSNTNLVPLKTVNNVTDALMGKFNP